jgi:ribulose-phosphate 3-epimerase
MVPKIHAVRDMIDASGFDIDLQVDGGMAANTILLARDAGADVFVAGSAIFGTGDYTRAMAVLRRAAQGRQ